jgi:hypothetical protein
MYVCTIYIYDSCFTASVFKVIKLRVLKLTGHLELVERIRNMTFCRKILSKEAT